MFVLGSIMFLALHRPNNGGEGEIALVEYSEVLKEVDSTMQQVTQMFGSRR